MLKAENIAVVHESIFQRKLGSLPAAFLTQVQEALKKALLRNTAKVTLFGTRINTDFTDDSPERTLKNPIF